MKRMKKSMLAMLMGMLICLLTAAPVFAVEKTPAPKGFKGTVQMGFIDKYGYYNPGAALKVSWEPVPGEYIHYEVWKREVLTDGFWSSWHQIQVTDETTAEASSLGGYFQIKVRVQTRLAEYTEPVTFLGCVGITEEPAFEEIHETGGTWLQDGVDWKYILPNGNNAVEEWVLDGGKHYYFGMHGNMGKHWSQDGHYLCEDGSAIEDNLERFTYDNIYNYVSDIPDNADNWEITGTWNNELTVEKVRYKMKQTTGINNFRYIYKDDKDAIGKRFGYDGVNFGFSVGEHFGLMKIEEAGETRYQVTILVRPTSTSYNKAGLEALCLLIDDEVFPVLMNDYQNEVFKLDTWTTVGNYSYNVSEYGGEVIYMIKEV